ncbi:hypothetical protein DFQ27_007432, partial [Actinomortierella ambigua]
MPILSISSDKSPNTHINPLEEYRPEMEPIETDLRLRPLSGDQLSAHHGYINVLNDTDTAMQPPANEARLRPNEPSNYEFTKVFEQTATQDTVFEQDPYVTDLLNYIEDLLGRCLEAESRCAAVESQVREEMTQEMERRLQHMEAYYKDQLHDEASVKEAKVTRQKDPLTRAKDSEETSVVQELQSEIRHLEDTATGYQRDAERAWHSLAQAEERYQELTKIVESLQSQLSQWVGWFGAAPCVAVTASSTQEEAPEDISNAPSKIRRSEGFATTTQWDAAENEEDEQGDVGVHEEPATFEEVVRGEQDQAQVKVEEEEADGEWKKIMTELELLLQAPPQQRPLPSTHEVIDVLHSRGATPEPQEPSEKTLPFPSSISMQPPLSQSSAAKGNSRSPSIEPSRSSDHDNNTNGCTIPDQAPYDDAAYNEEREVEMRGHEGLEKWDQWCERTGRQATEFRPQSAVRHGKKRRRSPSPESTRGDIGDDDKGGSPRSLR